MPQCVVSSAQVHKSTVYQNIPLYLERGDGDALTNTAKLDASEGSLDFGKELSV